MTHGILVVLFPLIAPIIKISPLVCQRWNITLLPEGACPSRGTTFYGETLGCFDRYVAGEMPPGTFTQTILQVFPFRLLMLGIRVNKVGCLSCFIRWELLAAAFILLMLQMSNCRGCCRRKIWW